ncbi:unnamed protein product [Caretta caretta]
MRLLLLYTWPFKMSNSHRTAFTASIKAFPSASFALLACVLIMAVLLSNLSSRERDSAEPLKTDSPRENATCAKRSTGRLCRYNKEMNIGLHHIGLGEQKRLCIEIPPKLSENANREKFSWH